MGNKMNKTAIMMMRIMAVLVSGIIISVAFLANVGTYSWFNSSAGGNAKVTAAETEDIIDTLELIYESEDTETGACVNPTALKIRKAAGFEQDPLIFFSLEDEAAEYILHINPVRLDSNAYYIIPIETDMNIDQHAKIYNRTTKIYGKIKIKYMNEYIDASKDIAFTKEFLVNRLMAAIIRDNVQEEESQPRVAMMRFSSLVETPEKTINYIEAEENSRSVIKDMTLKAIKSLVELVEWKGVDVVFGDGKLSDEALFSMGLGLTTDQELLMDLMYPGLKEYMEGLKSYISKLRGDIEEKNTRLASLDAELASLKSQYEQLLAENAELTEQLNGMIPVIPPVQPPVISVPDVAPPPAAGGGSTGGGSSIPDGSIPDNGTAPSDSIPSGGTGDTGTGDTGTGDVGTGDTGTGDVGTGDTGTGDIGTGDAGTGDTGTGDIGTGDAGTGADDTGETSTGSDEESSGTGSIIIE